jgi:uncharacterized protein
MHVTPRVAIIGSGISGLAAAHTLQGHADITLFEAGDYFGGHTHTVDITLPNAQGVPTSFGVDTGFLVFNERTYPNLIGLFADLDIPTVGSDMSFSVQVRDAPGAQGVEWSGTRLSSVFAQRGNLVRPAFLRMLADVLRFNRLVTRMAQFPLDDELAQPLHRFLDQHGFSTSFRNWYLLPMLGCIWSCPTDQMLRFPVATLVRFCDNHGLAQITQRPRWFTVAGGARRYVQAMVKPIADRRLNTPVTRIDRDEHGIRIVSEHQGMGRVERFDHVVVATHSDQALAMLSEPSAAEQRVLSAIRYQPNVAVLHTDVSALPSRPSTWAAWNYERAATTDQESRQVCLHYLINQLQPLPVSQPVIVSLNPLRPIAPASVLGRYDYAHPVFDVPAIAAQKEVGGLQGHRNTWFAGAWTGYGFHEDGLKSGLAVGRQWLQQHVAGRAS